MCRRYVDKAKYIDFMRRKISLYTKRVLLLGHHIKFAKTVDVHISSSLTAKEGSITIGARCLIEKGAIVRTYGARIMIGSDTTIGPYSCIYGGGRVTIGNAVRIGPLCSIIAGNHVFESDALPIFRQGMTHKGIEICDDVWLGSGVSILDGVRLGRGAVVAAGAVVTRSVPDGNVVGGVPARYIKSR